MEDQLLGLTTSLLDLNVVSHIMVFTFSVSLVTHKKCKQEYVKLIYYIFYTVFTTFKGSS